MTQSLSRYHGLSEELTALGPFFTVATHGRGELPSPPWQTMSELVNDDGVLSARVDAVGTALAQRAGKLPVDVEFRVAASVAHLGLIARLLAPAIGAIALGYTPASLALDDLWWQNKLGGPYPLSITPSASAEFPGAGTAIEAITAAIAGAYDVSQRVLWGNIGSAANSAAQQIRTARDDLTLPAQAVADVILADPRIDGGALRAGPSFRRRSCCLIYRIAGNTGAVCGDCILR